MGTVSRSYALLCRRRDAQRYTRSPTNADVAPCAVTSQTLPIRIRCFPQDPVKVRYAKSGRLHAGGVCTEGVFTNRGTFSTLLRGDHLIFVVLFCIIQNDRTIDASGCQIKAAVNICRVKLE